MRKLILGLMVAIFALNGYAVEKKISEMDALAQGSWATGDLFPIVDISAGVAGITKKTSVADFDLRFFKLSDILTMARGGTGSSSISTGVVTSNGSTLSSVGTLTTALGGTGLSTTGTAGGWVQSNGGTNNMFVSSTTTTGKIIDGTANEIQLTVQGNGTQTTDPFVVESSDGTDRLKVLGSASSYGVQVGSVAPTSVQLFNVVSSSSVAAQIETSGTGNTAAKLDLVRRETGDVASWSLGTGINNDSRFEIYNNDNTRSDLAITKSSGAVRIRGTNTNDTASAGDYGEPATCSQASNTNFPTSNQYGDVCNISLTAGDWDVSFTIWMTLNGSTTTQFLAGIGTATGNNGAGVSAGINGTDYTGTIPSRLTMSISPVRISVASTTTYYFKVLGVYSVATPQYVGRMSARRMR